MKVWRARRVVRSAEGVTNLMNVDPGKPKPKQKTQILSVPKEEGTVPHLVPDVEAIVLQRGARLDIVHVASDEHGHVRQKTRDDLLFSNHIVAPTVMVRRQVMLETGLFDSRFGLYEDWNLWTRIAKRHDIAYSHEPMGPAAGGAV